MSDTERRAEYERFLRIDAAFRAGDLDALRAAVEDDDAIPNGPMPLAIGTCLGYAIYHSPIAFIRTLLELGADPNPKDHAGFPPLLAALACSRTRPGAAARPDVPEILRLLIEHGADPDQRGINDWTPLHMAVAEHAAEAIPILLAAGADPTLATSVDDYETPVEMARQLGRDNLAALLGATSR